MAIETRVVAITATGYTQIAAGKTSISARSSKNSPFFVVIVGVGDTAPLADETNKDDIGRNEALRVSGQLFDVYAMAKISDDTLKIVRS